MKSPIRFRATFEQPRGVLNPSKWRLPGPIEVEIWQKMAGPPAVWEARRPDNKAKMSITPQSTHATIQGQMLMYFDAQLSPWEAFDRQGKLESDEWQIDAKSGQPVVNELRRSRLAEKEIHERAEKSRQQKETYERDYEPQ